MKKYVGMELRHPQIYGTIILEDTPDCAPSKGQKRKASISQKIWTIIWRIILGILIIATTIGICAALLFVFAKFTSQTQLGAVLMGILMAQILVIGSLLGFGLIISAFKRELWKRR